MRPSIRNIGRKMCMEPTCTISTILLWVRTMRNWRRRRHRKPPSSRSMKSNTILYSWWSSRSSAYQINMDNTPSGLYSCIPDDYTTPSIIQTRKRPITCSDSVMRRRSTKREMGASYQGGSNNMVLTYFIYYMPLVLTRCCKMKIRTRKQQDKICFVPSSTSITPINPGFLT